MKNIAVIRYAFLLLGSVIGAGFITGRELVSFFGYENYLFGVILSGFSFFVLFSVVLKAGKGCYTQDELFKKISKKPKILSGAFAISVFITAGSTASALFEVFNTDVFLLKAALCFVILFLCWISCAFGVERIKTVNLYLTFAVIIVTVILLPDNGTDFSNAFKSVSGVRFYDSLSYAFFNTFINVSVILRRPEKGKNTFKAIVFFTVSLTVFSLLMLNGISDMKGNATTLNAPVFSVVKNIRLFRVICLFAIITSLLTSLYPLFVYGKAVFTKSKGLPVFFGIYAFSFLGLKNIVGYAYPVIAGFGAVMLFLCAFYSIRKIGIKRRKETNNTYMIFEKR